MEITNSVLLIISIRNKELQITCSLVISKSSSFNLLDKISNITFNKIISSKYLPDTNRKRRITSHISLIKVIVYQTLPLKIMVLKINVSNLPNLHKKDLIQRNIILKNIHTIRVSNRLVLVLLISQALTIQKRITLVYQENARRDHQIAVSLISHKIKIIQLQIIDM